MGQQLPILTWSNKLFFLFAVLFFTNSIFAQTDTTSIHLSDTTQIDTVVVVKPFTDSFFISYDLQKLQKAPASQQWYLKIKDKPSLHVNKPVERKVTVEKWFFFLLLGQLLLIIAIKKAYPLAFSQITEAVISDAEFREMIESSGDVWSMPKLLPSVIILIHLSIVAHLFLLFFDFPTIDSGFMSYIKIFSAATIVFVFQKITKEIFGYIFDAGSIIKIYNLEQKSLNFLIAMAALPVSAFFYYNSGTDNKQIFIYMTGAVFALQMIYNIIRLSLRREVAGVRTSIFTFSYLCAFEVLPVLVGLKILKNIFMNG